MKYGKNPKGNKVRKKVIITDLGGVLDLFLPFVNFVAGRI